jgi:hypothetical protein
VGCGGSVRGCGGSVGMWWLKNGDVVAQLAKARLSEPAVPGSIPASFTVS